MRGAVGLTLDFCAGKRPRGSGAPTLVRDHIRRLQVHFDGPSYGVGWAAGAGGDAKFRPLVGDARLALDAVPPFK